MQSGLFIFIFGVIPSVFSQTCKPQNMDFRYYKKSYITRLPFVIGAYVDRCPGLINVYFDWELIHGGKVIMRSQHPDCLIDGYKHFRSKTIFSKDTFLKVRVSHHIFMADYIEKEIKLNFIPEPLHLEIVGGNSIIHPSDTVLEMDGISFSYDPSFPPGKNSITDYDIKWSVQPELKPGSDIGSKTPKIDASFFMLGETYNFTMTVTREDSQQIKEYYFKGSVSQIVKIRKIYSKPTLKISCLENCENLNHQDPVVLVINCIHNCQYVQSKWIWEIDPKVNDRYLQFGTGLNRIRISKLAYRAGDKVTVRVKNGVNDEELTIFYADNIKTGRCSIRPKEGVSAVTLFRVSCTGYRSTSKIVRFEIYQAFEGADPGVMVTYNSTLENEFFLAPGSPALLLVVMEDESFMKAQQLIAVEVQLPVVRLKDIKMLILDPSISYSVYTLSVKNLRHELIQTVSFIVDALNTLTDISPLEKRSLYLQMVKYVSFVQLDYFPSIVQILSVCHKIKIFHKLPFDTDTPRKIAVIMKSLIKTLYDNMLKNIEEVPKGNLESLFKNVLAVSTLLMEPIKEVQEYLNTTLNPRDYDSYDEMVHERLDMRNDFREITENCLTTVELMSVIVLNQIVVGEEMTLYSSRLIHFYVGKFVPLELPDFITYRDLTNSRVEFTDELKRFLAKTYPSVSIIFGIFLHDPIWWHAKISHFRTDKVVFGIYHGVKRLTKVPAPFYILPAVKDIPFSRINGRVTDATLFNIAVHRILVEPKVQVLAYFEPSTQRFKARFSNCYCDPEDMVHASTITPELFERDRTLQYMPELNKKQAFLCIMRLDSAELHYTAMVIEFTCAYWDPITGDLEKEFIQVSKHHITPNENLGCTSFHLSFFTGEVIAPEHYLNEPLLIDFYIKLIRNFYMIALIVFLLCLWLLLLLWAFMKDKRFAKKNVVCKLDDNVPGDQHIYLVVVFTGVFIDAGTTADVAIQIVGEKNESRVHLIKCCEMSLLKRNSQDWFIIYTPQNLGSLKAIRLWHNCKGSEPHWYCQRIIVQHLETGNQYFFLVEEWLSLIWGSGKIFREVQVKHWMEMEKWKLLFNIKMEKIKDDHLWVSVIARAPQSSFNNKERVSTAIAAIFISMLACAILFGYPQGAPSDSIDPQTKYYITPETIIIFTESWLISLPVIFFIILIFKNSAP